LLFTRSKFSNSGIMRETSLSIFFITDKYTKKIIDKKIGS
jgi:hypothetical protein